jgi:homoserine acetyltransferase
MNLANIPLAAKVGAGAIAGLALLGGGAAVGAHLGGVQASSVTTTGPIVASAAPSGQPAANGAAAAANQAARRAALQAEAQVLGISLKELNADFKAGKTVQQLATAKGLSQDQFRTQFQQALKPMLDQAVTSGTLTSAQEQRAITRLDAAIPNWSQVGQAQKAARPSPSATP